MHPFGSPVLHQKLPRVQPGHLRPHPETWLVNQETMPLGSLLGAMSRRVRRTPYSGGTFQQTESIRIRVSGNHVRPNRGIKVYEVMVQRAPFLRTNQNILPRSNSRRRICFLEGGLDAGGKMLLLQINHESRRWRVLQKEVHVHDYLVIKLLHPPDLLYT